MWGQTPSFPFSLKQFLDLTDAQVLQIGKFSDAYSQMVREKQIRISQLQFEIFNETAKDPIDPMALGVRYAEMAQLQKDAQKDLANLKVSVRQALTDAQRAKVKTLDDAMKLQPLISEALCVGLIDPAAIQGIPAARIVAIRDPISFFGNCYGDGLTTLVPPGV